MRQDHFWFRQRNHARNLPRRPQFTSLKSGKGLVICPCIICLRLTVTRRGELHEPAFSAAVDRTDCFSITCPRCFRSVVANSEGRPPALPPLSFSHSPFCFMPLPPSLPSNLAA